MNPVCAIQKQISHYFFLNHDKAGFSNIKKEYSVWTEKVIFQYQMVEILKQLFSKSSKINWYMIYVIVLFSYKS